MENHLTTENLKQAHKEFEIAARHLRRGLLVLTAHRRLENLVKLDEIDATQIQLLSSQLLKFFQIQNAYLSNDDSGYIAELQNLLCELDNSLNVTRVDDMLSERELRTSREIDV